MNVARMNEQLMYRNPMPVAEIMLLNHFYYPVCPRCQLTFEREFQSYCDRCGQCLDWQNFSAAKLKKE